MKQLYKRIALTGAGWFFALCPALAQPADHIGIEHLSTYHTGIFDDGAAEISAYDAASHTLFFSNAADKTVVALDLSNVVNPSPIDTIDITLYGGNVNSVAVNNGILAIAVEANVKQDPGFVAFFDANTRMHLNTITVGALPDMLTFTPDGNKMVVACEGEPDDDYLVDPNGGVSIIDISGGVGTATVDNLDFTAFESYRASFESGALDNWNYTATPATYNTEGDSVVDGNDDVWAVIQEFTGDINNACHGNLFYGGQDLENGNGGGAFQHTLDFDPISLAGHTEAYVSFRYHSVGYESADSVGYILEYDNGTTWNMANYVELNRDTNWTTVTIEVPMPQTDVRLRLMARQNGSTDYVGFDDVKLTFFNPEVRIFGNDDMSTVAADLEPEYVAISPDGLTAMVICQENNAFAQVDLQTNTINSIISMGYKDHSLPGNGIDASNTTAAINITNWPIKGLYLPDAADAFAVNGQTYYLTANEGDSRDYDGYSEEDRVKDLDLDTLVFPNYATLQAEDMLGRLKTTLSMGDIDCDGEFEEIYSYGGRSFSIFDASGALVWDSGDEFEQIVAAADPANFNSTNDDNTSFKNRSDDKGPEPEAIEIAHVNGRDYAFIGLERMGGIMVYEITDPTQPRFVDYLNNRDFSASESSPQAGDLGVEGLVFVPKNDSPNGRNLLISSNEVSGTISMFQLDVNLTVDSSFVVDEFDLVNPPMIGVYGADTLYEGGISGLHYVDGSTNEFYLITDRGPNADARNHPMATGATKLFPFPSYAPKIMRVNASNDSLNINSLASVKRPGGSDASGIPLPVGAGNTGEAAWSDTLATAIPSDIWGIDSEGIVEDNNGDLWICDEYGASVWKLDGSNYEASQRYTPFPVQPEDVALDSMIGKRRPNRGFEGVAYTPDGHLVAILQSPVYNPDAATSHASQLHRMVKINPNTGTMEMYAYEHRAPVGNIRNRDWKLGDLVAINNDEFFVIEHAERQGYNYKDVFKIDFAGATPIVMENYGGLSFEALVDSATAALNGVNTVGKTHWLDLLELGWDHSHDKPEGITIMNDSTIAIINDNDYAIDSPNQDGDIVTTGKTTRLYIYHLPQDKQINHASPYCELTLGSDTTFCDGGSVTLDAGTAFDTYLWSDNSTTQTLDVTGTGVITVTGTNAVGCSVMDTVNVTVNALPMIEIGADTVICVNHNLTLNAGPGFADYLWSDGETNPSTVVSGPMLGVGTYPYTVNVTDANGCSASDMITVTIDACTGIEENNALTVNAYPNPTRGELTVALNGSFDLATATLVDLTGKTVRQVQLNKGNNRLNLHDLATGLYYLHVSSNSQHSTVSISVE